MSSEASRPGSTWRPPTWLAALLVLLAFTIVHGDRVVRNLHHSHWEDGRHFHHNREQIHSLADCFRKASAWAGGAEATYRPLSASLYYYAGRALFHNRLEVYHTLNAGVFVLHGLLLFLVCRQLRPGRWSLLPPLLFVSRLAHLQAATYTSLFDDLSCTALGLAGLGLFLHARARDRSWPAAVGVLLFGLALLCKEAAAAWPVVLVAYAWLFDERIHWRRYAAAFAPVLVWAAVYPRLIRALYPEATPQFALDLAPTRVLSRYAAYLIEFVNHFIDPVDPEKAHFAMAPRVEALAARGPVIAAVALLIVAEIAVLGLARLRPSALGPALRVSAFGGAWFLAAMAPFVVVGHRLFMRYGYYGHAGIATALGGVGLGLPRVLAFARPWRAR